MTEKTDIRTDTAHFDQKDEVFKRALWDSELREKLVPFPGEYPYKKEKTGYRKLDLALRMAAWSLEHEFGLGNVRSNDGLYRWDGVPEKARGYMEFPKPVDLNGEEAAVAVKKAAGYFGAALAGITAFDRSYLYTAQYDTLKKESKPLEIPEDCSNVIVMAIEMDHESMKASPDFIAGAATGLGYSKMAFTSYLMANFIRHLGYRALPCGNDTAMSIPLAVNAGLGELGRNGLLITEKYGPRVRLCKVITDMPLKHDSFKPFGVERFCEVCKKCARLCPSGSISRGPKTTEGPSEISSDSGPLKWYINPETCYQFWRKNGVDCATCVRTCPFTKEQGILHDTVRFFIKHLPVLNPFILLLDNILGYHTRKAPVHFWDS